MARGRGNARGNPGRNRQITRNRQVPQVINNNNNQIENCGTCSAGIGDDPIGCDRCEKWFHPSSLCMGIPESVIANIREYGGSGISYICTGCRSG